MQRLSFLLLATLLANPAAEGVEPRERTPEQASEAARQFEEAPPHREAESVRLLGQNMDEFYPTPNAGDMPTHNELIRYIRSAHANAAEIQEAIDVKGVMFVDVSPLFAKDEGKDLNWVIYNNRDRIPELRAQLVENPVTARALGDNDIDPMNVLAVQLEATGLMTVYVRPG